MELSFVPRRRLLESLEAGYSLIAGFDYVPSDWAILMAAPGVSLQADPAAVLGYFNVKRPSLSRNQRWCRHGHAVERGERECKVCRRQRDKARYVVNKVVPA